MIYELWDETGLSLVAAYDTEDTAMVAVRMAVAARGPDAVRTWVMRERDPSTRGAGTVRARGATLHRLALLSVALR